MTTALSPNSVYAEIDSSPHFDFSKTMSPKFEKSNQPMFTSGASTLSTSEYTDVYANQDEVKLSAVCSPLPPTPSQTHDGGVLRRVSVDSAIKNFGINKKTTFNAKAPPPATPPKSSSAAHNSQLTSPVPRFNFNESHSDPALRKRSSISAASPTMERDEAIFRGNVSENIKQMALIISSGIQNKPTE